MLERRAVSSGWPKEEIRASHDVVPTYGALVWGASTVIPTREVDPLAATRAHDHGFARSRPRPHGEPLFTRGVQLALLEADVLGQ